MSDMPCALVTDLVRATPPPTESPLESPTVPPTLQLPPEYADIFVNLVKDIATILLQGNSITADNIRPAPPNTPTDSVISVARMQVPKLEYKAVQEV